MGNQHVAISLALVMILETHVLLQVRLQRIPFDMLMKTSMHWWNPRGKNSGNTLRKYDYCFLCVLNSLDFEEK